MSYKTLAANVEILYAGRPFSMGGSVTLTIIDDTTGATLDSFVLLSGGGACEIVAETEKDGERVLKASPPSGLENGYCPLSSTITTPDQIDVRGSFAGEEGLGSSMSEWELLI